MQLLSGASRDTSLALPYLMEEISSLYRVERNKEMRELGQLRPEDPYIVKDKKDGIWYHAEVVKVVRGHIVMLVYIDFGNTVVVPRH